MPAALVSKASLGLEEKKKKKEVVISAHVCKVLNLMLWMMKGVNRV